MRGNAHLITAPGSIEIPDGFGAKSQRQRLSCRSRGRGRDRLGWSRPTSQPAEVFLCLLASSVPIPICWHGPTGLRPPARWASSRDSSTRRCENVVQDNNSARRCIRSGHRVVGIGRDRASARQLCQSGDLQYGSWQRRRRLFSVRWPVLQHRLSAVRSSLQDNTRRLVTSAIALHFFPPPLSGGGQGKAPRKTGALPLASGSATYAACF